MIKSEKLIFPAIAAFSLALTVPAFAGARIMTDDELDGISAGGFDINVDSVMAFRAVVEQAGATSGAFAQGRVAARQAAAAIQNNIAAIYAAKGDISGAGINNANSLSLKGITDAMQHNLAVIAARKGAVKDSVINNMNDALTDSLLSGLTQENVGIIVASGNVENCAIDNANLNPANTAGQAAAAIESYVLHNVGGASCIQVTANQQAGQKNLGIIISRFGQVINSLIKNSNRGK